MEIRQYLSVMVEKGASDVYLTFPGSHDRFH